MSAVSQNHLPTAVSVFSRSLSALELGVQLYMLMAFERYFSIMLFMQIQQTRRYLSLLHCVPANTVLSSCVNLWINHSLIIRSSLIFEPCETRTICTRRRTNEVLKVSLAFAGANGGDCRPLLLGANISHGTRGWNHQFRLF